MSLPPTFEGVVLLYALRGSIFGCRQGFKSPPPFPGAVLAVQKLVDCVRTETVLALDAQRGSAPLIVSGVQCDDDELAFGNYGPKRWAWVYESPRQLETPVAVKGMLGLYALPATVLEAVWAQVDGNVTK